METVGMSWSELQALIRELAILAGVGALIFTAAQVRQMQKAREAESLLKILEMSFLALGANPLATFRRNFQMKPVFPSYEEFVCREDTQEAAQVGRLIWYYIYMGIALRQRLLPEEALMRWHAPAITRTWRSLLPIIEGVRKETGSPGFARHFEFLAVRAAQWLRRYQAAEHKFFARVQEETRDLAAELQPFDAVVYTERDKQG